MLLIGGLLLEIAVLLIILCCDRFEDEPCDVDCGVILLETDRPHCWTEQGLCGRRGGEIRVSGIGD